MYRLTCSIKSYRSCMFVCYNFQNALILVAVLCMAVIIGA